MDNKEKISKLFEKMRNIESDVSMLKDELYYLTMDNFCEDDKEEVNEESEDKVSDINLDKLCGEVVLKKAYYDELTGEVTITLNNGEQIVVNVDKEDKEDVNIDSTLKFICSYTTRKKREGEVDGREHIFISEDKAKFLIDGHNSNVLAYTEINGNKYFTLTEQLKECNGYIIDPNGLDSLIENNYRNNLGINFAVIYVYADTVEREIRYIHREGNTPDSSEASRIREFYRRNSSETDQFDKMESNINLDKVLKRNIDHPNSELIRYSTYISYDNIDNVIVKRIPVLVAINNDNFNYEYYRGIEGDMRSFIVDQIYKNPNTLFCVIGRTASGKDTIAKMLSMDYGEWIECGKRDNIFSPSAENTVICSLLKNNFGTSK